MTILLIQDYKLYQIVYNILILINQLLQKNQKAIKAEQPILLLLSKADLDNSNFSVVNKS